MKGERCPLRHNHNNDVLPPICAKYCGEIVESGDFSFVSFDRFQLGDPDDCKAEVYVERTTYGRFAGDSSLARFVCTLDVCIQHRTEGGDVGNTWYEFQCKNPNESI